MSGANYIKLCVRCHNRKNTGGTPFCTKCLLQQVHFYYDPDSYLAEFISEIEDYKKILNEND